MAWPAAVRCAAVVLYICIQQYVCCTSSYMIVVVSLSHHITPYMTASLFLFMLHTLYEVLFLPLVSGRWPIRTFSSNNTIHTPQSALYRSHYILLSIQQWCHILRIMFYVLLVWHKRRYFVLDLWVHFVSPRIMYYDVVLYRCIYVSCIIPPSTYDRMMCIISITVCIIPLTKD